MSPGSAATPPASTCASGDVERVVGAVLCGGGSRRMGRDKASLDLGGRPMATIVHDALAGAGIARVLAIGGPASLQSVSGMEAVPDRFPGQGPLGAIITALHAASPTPADRVAVLACDVPLVNVDLVRALVAQSGPDHGAMAAGPDGRTHPLISVLPVSWVPILEACLATDRSVTSALAGLPISLVAADAIVVSNVNAPDDLARAEEALRRRSTWPADGAR